MDISSYIFISFFLFAIGLLGMILKRNALILFLSVELMLNSANLLFIAFARSWNNETGLVWTLFVFLLAAAEAAVGLTLILNLSRSRRTVDVDQYTSLRG